MIKIIINGANGKMGRTTVAAIANEKDLQLVATTSNGDDLISIIKKNKADAVIDWTTPASVFDNTKKIIEAGARPVIGTTGLTSEQIKILSEQCVQKKIGGIIAPNFSLGAILMMKYAQDAAKYFNDVEIIEYHHPQKKDAPSGTAKKTAELISNGAKKNIPIHSVRLPGVFANQEVIFGGNGETLTLQHNATDRNAMMPGLFLCCRKVMTLNKLICGMEELM
ncbi:MAG TPA: 4-hydroxy-tetrahydrodipicolinate reductase [Coxiellaceae bacterium]|nr:MAG: 4-hydroxy-tetrahydrodipicolinate reductase [Gammaproteobacteria bacterium RIFCSPHIGHO2_12_FULL_36_30]HLB56006.1 4-hydroxy-tetrahydrodipicolinate reductase [Coxiellaceae bacterium]